MARLRHPIRIIPLIPAPVDVIPSIARPLESIFTATIRIDPPTADVIDRTYDDSRGQYNSTQLITELLPRVSISGEKILGITSVDLFVPILTYVFGEAQLDGTVCVVSTYRLDDAVYGLPSDPVLFFERTLKESVHELGHTFGLYHCRNIACAMHASTAVEDIDLKESVLCEDCKTKIGVL